MYRISRGQPRLALSISRSGGGAGASRRPRLVLSMGDPAGVGPEVVLRTLADRAEAGNWDVCVAGDPAVLRWWAGQLSLPEAVSVIDAAVPAGPVVPGRPTNEGALAALASVETAARLCMDGEADAMVTAPVSKAAIAATGTPFQGHTEFLAKLTNANGFAMTFVHERQCVGLVTTHLSLAQVPAALTTGLVLEKLLILSGGLESWLGVSNPRIAITALNPHAGESGTFGDEEERVIAPAVARARDAGVNASGPHPADSIFVGHGDPDAGGPGSPFDAVLAMYHDQGTIAAKLMGFGQCVNLTMGLPIVRTSVDHGTAFEIAGRGEADHGSMAAAVRLAGAIAARRIAGQGESA